MGLDMFLTGVKIFGEKHSLRLKSEQEKVQTPERIRLGVYPIFLKEEHYCLAIWRKHPNLHGYIVDNHGPLTDSEPLYLACDQLLDILDAVKNDRLPHAEGFFFGESKPWQKEQSIILLERAIAWYEEKEDHVGKELTYMASW